MRTHGVQVEEGGRRRTFGRDNGSRQGQRGKAPVTVVCLRDAGSTNRISLQISLAVYCGSSAIMQWGNRRTLGVSVSRADEGRRSGSPGAGVISLLLRGKEGKRKGTMGKQGGLRINTNTYPHQSPLKLGSLEYAGGPLQRGWRRGPFVWSGFVCVRPFLQGCRSPSTGKK